MVKLTFASAFFFLVAFFTLAVASPTETRTTDDIIQTIGKASTDLNNLTKSLKSIKNGLSASKAIVINTEFKKVQRDLNQLDQDISTTKNVTNAQAVFNAVHDLVPIVVNTLQAVIEKKNIFVQLSASQYVLKQLIKTEKATAQVAIAMIAKGPADLKQEATHLMNEMEDAFDNAIKAYMYH